MVSNKPKISKRVKEAKAICQEQGLRLTQIRQRVFELMLEQGVPCTAYQLLDLLKTNGQTSAAPPTIYRALEFLLQAGLIHRIDHNNSYLVCDHTNHNHTAQFLICDVCGSVAEMDMEARLLKSLVKNASAHGFKVSQGAFEIHGQCSSCQRDK